MESRAWRDHLHLSFVRLALCPKLARGLLRFDLDSLHTVPDAAVEVSVLLEEPP